LGVTAGTANFFQLGVGGHHLETRAAPGAVDRIRCPMRRNQRTEKDVGVEHHPHYCALAQSSASSTIAARSASLTPAFAVLASSALSSRRCARTASSTKRDRSPLRPPPWLARNIRNAWSVAAEAAMFQRVLAIFDS